MCAKKARAARYAQDRALSHVTKKKKVYRRRLHERVDSNHWSYIRLSFLYSGRWSCFRKSSPKPPVYPLPGVELLILHYHRLARFTDQNLFLEKNIKKWLPGNVTMSELMYVFVRRETCTWHPGFGGYWRSVRGYVLIGISSTPSYPSCMYGCCLSNPAAAAEG